MGRVEFGVVDVDRRRAAMLVVVAKSLAVESGRLTRISVGFSLFTKLHWIIVGRR